MYEARPEYLPRELVRLTKDRSPAGPFIWVGREGVTLLSQQERMDFADATISRFPRNRDGTIQWQEVDDELIHWAGDEDEVDIAQVVLELAGSSDELILDWGNLAVPAIRITATMLRANVEPICQSKPEFWMVSDQGRTILERTFAGLVTVAQIPGPEASEASQGAGFSL